MNTEQGDKTNPSEVLICSPVRILELFRHEVEVVPPRVGVDAGVEGDRDLAGVGGGAGPRVLKVGETI